MKSLAFILASLASVGHGQCPKDFLHKDLNSLNTRKYIVSQVGKFYLPASIFKKHESLASFTEEKDCKTAMVFRRIMSKQTGEVWTSVYTNHDNCDGGNSYGILYRGLAPRAANVACVIGDSTIYSVNCVNKPNCKD